MTNRCWRKSTIELKLTCIFYLISSQIAKWFFFCNLSSYSNLSYKIHETFQPLVTLLKFSFNESLVSSRPQSYNFEGKRPPMRKPKDQLGGNYLVFLSSLSKWEIPQLSQFVYFMRKVCLFVNFWMIKCTIMSNKR